MVKPDAATFHVVLPGWHQRQGVYEMIAPWTQATPPAADGNEPAHDLADNLQRTRERLDEIFAVWRQFENHYRAADADSVVSAMNDLVGPAMALEEAGAKIAQAHRDYAREADTRGHDQVKGDNDDWAPGFVSRYATYEADKYDLDRDEFEEKYGHDASDEYVELHMERIPFATMADHVSEAIGTTRTTYKNAIGGIDLEKLSELTFENRNEALDVADSPEELEEWIRESGLFKDLDLTDEQIARIAEDVFQEGGWNGTYTDAEGRTWIRAADGRMVRAGSMMDPNLNAQILAAMAQDPEIGDLDIKVPNPDGSGFVDWTVSQFAAQALGLTERHLTRGLTPAQKSRIGLHIKGVGFFVGLLQGVHGAERTRDIETATYPLMSEAELNDRYNRNIRVAAIKTGGSTVLGAGITFVAGAAAPLTGGGSIIAGVVIDTVTGEIVGYLVEEVDENLTTWDADEVDDLTAEDFPA